MNNLKSVDSWKDFLSESIMKVIFSLISGLTSFEFIYSLALFVQFPQNGLLLCNLQSKLHTHTHTEKTRTSTLWHVIVLWFDDLHLFYCNKEAAVRFAFTKQPVLLTVHERWMSLAGLQSLVLKHWAIWNWTRWARADLTNSSECCTETAGVTTHYSVMQTLF